MLLRIILAFSFLFLIEIGNGEEGLKQSGNQSAVLPGIFTVSSLLNDKPASSNRAKYAFVIDLGGGADMVLSDGTNWKHIRPGVLTDVVAQSNIPITALLSPPIIRLTSQSPLTISILINIATTNLYPGYTLHVVIPNGVLGTGASLGVGVGGLNTLPLLGGTWEDVQWTGTTLVELGRGTL